MLRMTLSTQCDTKSLETTASNLQKKYAQEVGEIYSPAPDC